MKNKQKKIEDQGEKQVKTIEEHSKQLLKSNKTQSIKDIIPEDKINQDAKMSSMEL